MLNAENVVIGIAALALGLVALGLFGLVYVVPRAECIKREAWHLDGGSVVQAQGTICAEWR